MFVATDAPVAPQIDKEADVVPHPAKYILAVFSAVVVAQAVPD